LAFAHSSLPLAHTSRGFLIHPLLSCSSAASERRSLQPHSASATYLDRHGGDDGELGVRTSPQVRGLCHGRPSRAGYRRGERRLFFCDVASRHDGGRNGKRCGQRQQQQPRIAGQAHREVHVGSSILNVIIGGIPQVRGICEARRERQALWRFVSSRRGTYSVYASASECVASVLQAMLTLTERTFCL
jgi:hypothetical protein